METLRLPAAAAGNAPRKPVPAANLKPTPRDHGGDVGKPSFVWPVYGFSDDINRPWKEPVASFFDWSAAADLVMHPARYGFEQRNLYIGAPVQNLGGGRFRCAA